MDIEFSDEKSIYEIDRLPELPPIQSQRLLPASDPLQSKTSKEQSIKEHFHDKTISSNHDGFYTIESNDECNILMYKYIYSNNEQDENENYTISAFSN